ncbi:MAG: hypothetical protein P4L69_21195 [Desulfosporosinus sp.]|nr:hypothetical protein [Desulfosporosinus sp.]
MEKAKLSKWPKKHVLFRKGLLKRIGITILIWTLVFSGFPFKGMLPTALADQATTNGNGLPVASDTATEAGNFGFTTTQPNMTDAQGNTVNKNTNNPLGASTTYMNRVSNLAISGYQWNGSNMGMTTYVKPSYLTTVQTLGILGPTTSYQSFMSNTSDIVPASPRTGNNSTTANIIDDYYNNDVKAMTAADLNGDGRQEDVTLVLVPTPGNTCYPFIIIRNYNIGADKKTSNGSSETTFQLSKIPIPMPASTDGKGFEYPVNIVAGDFNKGGRDELAALIDHTVYTLSSDNNFNLTLIAQHTFSMPAFPQFGNQITITSADTNNDGYANLLVTTAGAEEASLFSGQTLLIYDSDSLQSPKKVGLFFNNTNAIIHLTTPGVDVGDVLGDGNKSIVVGGKASDGHIYVATASYDPQTDTYPSNLTGNVYDIGFQGSGTGHNPSNMWGVENQASLTLKCVNLTAPTPGATQTLEIGGTLYLYNLAQGQFVKQDIKSWTYADTGAFNFDPGNSDGLLDINCDGDGIGSDGSSYILNTVVGNFDGNTEGKEQIVMLHYDNLNGTIGKGKERVVITYCSADDKGNITTLNTSIRPNGVSYQYPAICAPDVYGNAMSMTYEPDKSTFAFSNPSVIAVLGAVPYYKEIADRNSDYAGNLNNYSTAYGQSTESGTSSSNGVNVTAGVSVGYEASQSVFGVEVAKEEFKASVEYSFTSTWTHSKSITTGITYQNNMGADGTDSGSYGTDTAVVMVVPCDIYSYKVVASNGNTTEVTINVPYAPQTKQMSLSTYNNIASNVTGAPIIGSDVLNHTPGDPRTYPQAVSDIPGAKTGWLLSSGTSSTDLGANFQTTQNITVTDTQEQAFDHSLDVSFEVSLTVFGAMVGANAGVGYVDSDVTTSSKSTEVTGSVEGLPPGLPNYGFNWQLVFYSCDLTVPGSSTPQTCNVVSYLVQPQNGSSYPPSIPQNLQAVSGPNCESLTWDQASNSAGYHISRSDTADGDYAKIGDITGNAKTSFTDKTAQSGTTYYYKVGAYNSSGDGLDCDPVSGSPMSVSSIKIASPPKLNYNPGDVLDLSGLTVNLVYSDNSEKTIPLADFAANNLTVSPTDGTVLSAAYDGSSVTVNYAPTGSNPSITASAGQLIVDHVTSVELFTPPQLSYTVGDKLDLSPLNVVLVYSNTKRIGVSFKDFSTNNLMVNASNGSVLGISDNGTPVSVTYSGANSTGPISLDVGNLGVYASGEYDVLLAASFSVGNQKDAKALSPNQLLTADITATNTQAKPQNALVLLALYDEAGTMVKMTSGTVDLDKSGRAAATKPLSLSFILPEDTNDSYKARVFAWDGTKLSATNQVPVSNILQMP